MTTTPSLPQKRGRPMAMITPPPLPRRGWTLLSRKLCTTLTSTPYTSFFSKAVGRASLMYWLTWCPLRPWPSQTEKKWRPSYPSILGTKIYESWFCLYGLPGWWPTLVANANFVIQLNRSLVIFTVGSLKAAWFCYSPPAPPDLYCEVFSLDVPYFLS